MDTYMYIIEVHNSIHQKEIASYLNHTHFLQHYFSKSYTAVIELEYNIIYL
jgi:hypothetical protein